ncbi:MULTISPECIES: hypothetical protein [unclassified Pseudomonas]|uniref:hypothetical protein n=1 Tax=unclassified Pseudomonas TaxID=196821 RepID=UPI000C86E48D|nr:MULTISPECIES: hypothetical protein [unclassified Pseudomonas]PMV96412.1 hypothetical protein C1X55_18920 [Pseudomonas sp. GW460-C8]PMW23320.1 hypothetical protein C1X53_12220 [Pseudomonas sp. GW456-E6]PMW24204.1 hypothetical protein C1X40_05165 [Pseudomonas sp. GW456-11-11-14-TSB2]PMW40098.1 hypothetical protein C1X45_08475 [Pseudomonas sp. GW460-7]PMW41209.1 hypothetical protein C1X48_07110 [Pseudomonas sp. FW305-3-2-15-A-R2A1]
MAAEQAKAPELELNPEQDRNTSDIPDSLLSPPGKKSPFEKLCEKYILDGDRSPLLVNRIAYAMNQDERVRKICRVKAKKNGCDLNDFDEVLQRVMEVFFHSQLPKTVDTDAVYAVVYAVANNVTREVFRDRQKLVVNHSSIEDMLERGEEIGQSTLVDHEEIDHDREIDTQTATKRMAEALQRVISGEQTVADSGVFQMEQDPLVRLVLQKQETDDEIETPASTAQRNSQPTTGEKKARGRTELSVDQQELVDIGNKLGLRNQDYAFALGIGLPRLSSYIYGRTASVPDDVMNKARALFAEEPLRVERLKRFNRPMSQIFKEWETRLNPKNDEDLATMLGVTKMTIYRWRNDETKPDPTALARYEQWIDEYEKRFSHMLEQRLAK